MKKLLLIVTFFLTFTSFSQDLDTLIVKKNGAYRFNKTNSTNSYFVVNETVENEYRKLPQGRMPMKEMDAEGERALEQMKSKETNMQKCFLGIFREVFKGCGVENFNHTGRISFVFSINSKGDIANITIFAEANFLEIVGYDKFIEFETRVRTEYKFKPFIKQELGKFGIISNSLSIEQLNSAFK